MAGFNAEVKKRVTDLKSGIHLVSIIDASILKGLDKKPLISRRGETGIVIKFKDSKNHIFENVYYKGGEREFLFKKMCHSARIDLIKVKETGKFKAEALGKRIWLYIKEVYDIDGTDLVIDDLTGKPTINYYIFETGVVSESELRPSMKGDPSTNDGIASEKFVEYRQIFKPGTTMNEKAYQSAVVDEDDFEDLNLDSGIPKGNKAFKEVYEKIPKLAPNNDFTKQVEPKAKPFTEEVIDFDDF